MTASLFDAIRARNADPHAVFLRTPAGSSLTYGELFAASARMAAVLVALGVRPDECVAVQVDKSPDAVVLYLAIVRAGAVLLPLNPEYTLAETEYLLADARPTLVICRPGAMRSMGELAGRSGIAAVATLADDGSGSLLEMAARDAGPFEDVPRASSDLAAILYTSGTTGRPKGAMLTHENLLSNAAALVGLWRFTPADVLIHALPIFHAHGLFVAINVTMLAGASMIFLPRFEIAAVLAALPSATAFMGVPTFYTRLLGEPAFDRGAVAHMRLFVSGSAPLLAETHTAFQTRTGLAILERYGMTETGMIASNPYDGERRPGTVGFPLPGVEIRVGEGEGGAAREGVGILEVRGPNVFKGYWRQPEKTAAEFRPDGYFVTGDLAKIDARGYVHIVGRAKDLIITGGFNVYPKEVESEIDAVPGVVESAVVGVPHADFGEAVTAIVVVGSGLAADEPSIRAAIGPNLAKYKQPKRIIIVDELPRNTMGKVEKAVLRARYKALFER